MNTTCIQRTRPSHIPVPKDTKRIKNSHLKASTDLQMPSSPTPPNARTTTKQPTLPTQKASTAPTHPQWTRKTPLLPTPPASARQFNNKNHYRHFIPRPSPSRYNINSTFSGPSTCNNNRFHLQHPPRFNSQQPPLLPSPPYHQQSFTPRPHPQPQRHQSPVHTTLHFIPQVSYIPVLLPHTNHVVTPVQYTYTT